MRRCRIPNIQEDYLSLFFMGKKIALKEDFIEETLKRLPLSQKRAHY
jgi:Arc/MetJ family transcription regulator